MSAQPQAHRVALLAGKPAGQLLLHEIYHSIQGESRFAGLPCVFVRLAVCNLRCTWCDTPHAFNQGFPATIDSVVERVTSYRCPLVEVTGGEPLLQAESLVLLQRLADRDLQVLLETSGASPIDKVDPRVHIIMDLKCPGSGEVAANRWENLRHLKASDEIKFVLASRDDFDWALATSREHRLEERFQVLLSPAFHAVAPVQLAEWMLAAGSRARLQLQLHKYIWEPTARGV